MFSSQLRKYFRSDLASIVAEYAAELNRLFERYDKVVFVARRAMSLYDALVSTGLVVGDPQCERVFSSRALTYASCHLEGLDVAVVDDVMVKGESMKTAMLATSSVANTCSGFVAARNADCSIDVIDGRLRVLRTLKENDLYEFTREINDFVQGVGLTNNIDQPEFEIALPNGEDLRDVLVGHHWFDTTTRLQAESGFVSATITYDVQKLSQGFVDQLCGYEDVLAKIRIVSKVGSGKATLLPFVVLSALTTTQIDELYASFALMHLGSDSSRASDARCSDGEEIKNKLRIVQYLLSWQLGNAAIDTLGHESVLVHVERETMLFGSRITSNQLVETLNMPGCNCAELAIRGSKLSDYDVLMQRIRMRFIQRDLRCSDDDDGHSLFVTVNKLMAVVEEFDGEERGTLGIRAVASVSLDYMIDCGILVPFIRTDSSGRIIRAYKSGEIERLSKRQIRMFSCVILLCMEKLSITSIRCTTLNRLGVLFAREIKTLGVASSNDEASLFTFAYTEEDGFRRLADFQPGQTRVIADILVRGELLEWEDESRKAVKCPNLSVATRASMVFADNEKDFIELLARRFKEYLSKSKGEFADDKLLDTLVMYGSSRYVLGKVGYFLAEACDALNDTIESSEEGGTVRCDYLGESVQKLLDICAWANGQGNVRGKRTLSAEFDLVANRLAEKYMKLELEHNISDNYIGEADKALARRVINQVVEYARNVDALAGVREWLPTARRLACFGMVLNEKIRILLGPYTTFERMFSIHESKIGIIACASDSTDSTQLSKTYKVYPYIDGQTAAFKFDVFASAHDARSQFTFTIVFDAGSAGPWDLIWSGEYQAWDPVGAVERLSKVHSVRMREAVKALIERYAQAGTHRVAFCYKSEEERTTNDLKSWLPVSPSASPHLSPALVVDADIVSLFEECGTKVLVCGVNL